LWDGDLEEGNSPLPRWWLGLFWLTIAFSGVYLVLYPGLGSFAGLLGWSQVSQYDEEVAAAEEVYGEIFAALAATPVAELAGRPDALSAGRSLFATHCATCHGSDARGARGYPNLTDEEWLWGGDPDSIVASIRGGRTGVMPGFAATLEEDTLDLMVDYVEHLAGRQIDRERVGQAMPQFNVYCAACHGMSGRGNALLGAPSLVNEIWLHGGGRSVIRDVIANGRTNAMPAQEPLLGTDRVHVLAAYVYGLRGGD
jgi:cytochrome c oxidase cbb3-type subunit 3